MSREGYKPTPEEIKKAEDNLDVSPWKARRLSENQEKAVSELLDRQEANPSLKEIVTEIQGSIVVAQKLQSLDSTLINLYGHFQQTAVFSAHDWDKFGESVKEELPEIREEVERLAQLSGNDPFWKEMSEWFNEVDASLKGRSWLYRDTLDKTRDRHVSFPEEKTQSKVMEYIYNQVGENLSAVNAYRHGLEVASKSLTKEGK